MESKLCYAKLNYSVHSLRIHIGKSFPFFDVDPSRNRILVLGRELSVNMLELDPSVLAGKNELHLLTINIILQAQLGMPIK